jgi:hypothetical protein
MPICNYYIIDKERALYLTKLCSILISVINLVITEGIKKVMNEVGVSTLSKRSSLIANSVFFLQFLNTGVLLLLVTANFKEQGIDPYHLFHGSRTDFGMNWYAQTGDVIVQTMIISNLILPVILVTISELYR